MKRSLSRAERVRSRADFRRLLASPNRIGCPGAKLFYLESGQPRTRLGVSPARGFGRAVDRNRVRRLVREVFRHHKGRIVPGYDLLFVLFPGDYGYAQREQQILDLISRGRLLASSG